ncbi:hypothetical protein AB0J86_09340 [Micromonospora sp. NPDC049559]|uniref:hypothetical protein n=1 Tax=Micromonospora sp. NPDC049559 TaxID=3155923 RepID=UPI0034397269
MSTFLPPPTVPPRSPVPVPPAAATPPGGFVPPPGAWPGAGPAAPAAPRTLRLFLVRLVWEGTLFLLGLILSAVIAMGSDPFGARGGFWFNFASLALVTSAFALSARTATPNLAVGALAALAGTIFGKLLVAGWSGLPAGLVAMLTTLAIGLFLGLVTGLTSAPAWAVSLAGAVGGQALLLSMTGAQRAFFIGQVYSDRGSGASWALLAIFGSLAGGGLWLVPQVRRTLGANRTAAGPARGGRYRLLGSLVGLGGSSLVAGLGGVVTAWHLATAGYLSDTLLPLAVGAALLGGVSVFGRRGGVAGTILACFLIVLVQFELFQSEAPEWARDALLPTIVLLIGLLVGWFFERLGGPEPASALPTPAGAAPPPAVAPAARYGPPWAGPAAAPVPPATPMPAAPPAAQPTAAEPLPAEPAGAPTAAEPTTGAGSTGAGSSSGEAAGSAEGGTTPATMPVDR